MTLRIKLCGVRTVDDALLCVEAQRLSKTCEVVEAEAVGMSSNSPD